MIGIDRIDDHIWKVKYYLMRKHGCGQANLFISPLTWYIGTSRASVEFLKRFLNAKPYMIGRLLVKSELNTGTYDGAITALKQYLDVE